MFSVIVDRDAADHLRAIIFHHESSIVVHADA